MIYLVISSWDAVVKFFLIYWVKLENVNGSCVKSFLNKNWQSYFCSYALFNSSVLPVLTRLGAAELLFFKAIKPINRYATVSQNLVSNWDLHGAIHQACSYMWIYKISTQLCEDIWRNFHYPAICKACNERLLEVWLDFQKIWYTRISLEYFWKVPSQWGNSCVRTRVNVRRTKFYRSNIHPCKQGITRKRELD